MQLQRECNDRFEDIVAYVLGECDPKTALELETHFAICEQCRTTRGQLAAEETRIHSDVQKILERLAWAEKAVQQAVPPSPSLPACSQVLPPTEMPSGSLPTILIRDDSPYNGRNRPFVAYFSRVGPFSYFVSATLMCVAALAAWQYKIADRLGHVESDLETVVRHLPAAGGRITDMSQCRWPDVPPTAKNQAVAEPLALALNSDVPSGRRVQIESGLLEIAFRSGAKVILQGPAAFEVGDNGGFLNLGKLTGKFENKSKSGTTQSPRPNPFAIRTPTAVVTDLGTEFGVEVDDLGQTTSYVFRGRVRMDSAIHTDPRSVTLKSHEAARLEFTDGQKIELRSVDVDPRQFARRVHPERIPIGISGSGYDAQPGHPDPRWKVFRAGQEADPTPPAALLIGAIRSTWQPAIQGQAQWIGPTMTWHQPVPVGAVFTFRTDFDLKDGKPETAFLRGRAIAISSLKAIRLNGREISPSEEGKPKYAWEHGHMFQPFSIDHGFVAGNNVLEIDVESGDPPPPPGDFSALGLLIEIGGSVEVGP